MIGLMMDAPLLISGLIQRADQHHGDTEIVSRSADGNLHRSDYSAIHARSGKLAQALESLGIGPGDRVASLAWNGFRHLECYYAVSGMGAIMHTVNPRLFPEQIAWILNDAEDALVFFDQDLLPLVEQLIPQLSSVRHFVMLGASRERGTSKVIPDLLVYEGLLDAESAQFEWPQLDECTASGLCYTSGTTGNPKGVLYHHRSTMLHALLTAMPDMMNLSAQDVVMPVVPMFHVNAWGLPYSCALVGAKQVLPGPRLDGKSLYDLFESEGVTMSAGVPTVWAGLLDYMDNNDLRFKVPPRIVIGGSACPPAMMRRLEEDYGVQVLHAWGMTEMSPIGTVCTLKGKHRGLPVESKQRVLEKAGRPHFGIELKIIDGDGAELPRDGAASGDLLVRGPCVISSYFKEAGGSPLQGGWFPTGDVASIDKDSYIQITDRSKDVIKSGGEWISSIELENIAISHPAILEAAAIGVAHEKWGERPVLVAVRRQGLAVSGDELLAWFEGKVASFWKPDEVIFATELPHTATGKLSKLTLRKQYSNFLLKRSSQPTSPSCRSDV
jgi:acyl-CoA synthetase (AMP-forming)/AMP-acid ligase II